MNEHLSALEGFGGTARLFPLPNLVLFPYVIQPLHIFEPRYREMTADALAGDRLIALVLLRPGWEEDYHGRPPVYALACLGKIVADNKLDDGRYNLLLRGLTRVRIVEELDSGKQYRTARVEIVPDGEPPLPHVARHLREALGKVAPEWFPEQAQLLEQFRGLLESELPLGSLCDIFAFALPLDPEFKQQLLEELDVERRVRGLLEHLKDRSPPAVAAREFPPSFSNN